MEELAPAHMATQGQGWLQNPVSCFRGCLSFPQCPPWRTGLRQLRVPKEAVLSFQLLAAVCSAVWFLSNSLCSVRPHILLIKSLFGALRWFLLLVTEAL